MQELEDILDDDQDMADMYIGRRFDLQEKQAKRQASMASTFDDDHSDNGQFDHPASSLPGIPQSKTHLPHAHLILAIFLGLCLT